MTLKFHKSVVNPPLPESSRNLNDIIVDQSVALHRYEIDFKRALRQKRKRAHIPSSPMGPPQLSPTREKPPPEAVSERFTAVNFKDVAKIEHLLVRQLRFTPNSSLVWEVGLRS